MSQNPIMAETLVEKTKAPSNTLAYPDPSDAIDFQCLTDDTSPSISKTCLQLCQKCSSTGDEQEQPIHPASLTSFWKKAWTDGITCLKEHKDRRCRILIAQTLAVTAKAMYARIRPHALLIGQRDPLTLTFEDDVLDVSAALIAAALEDPDDGVAATALANLGHLVLSNTTSFGGLGEDCLEINVLNGSIHAPLAPTVRSVSSEDVAIPIQELQHRVVEQLAPRWLQLLHRRFRVPAVWSVLTQVMILGNRHDSHTMDRETYSKRWTQLDYEGHKEMFYKTLLEPALLHQFGSVAAYTAAVCTLRLGMGRRQPMMIASVLRECVSDDRTAAAAFLIALRDVELSQRIRSLLWIVTSGVMEMTMEVWTEIALHFVSYSSGSQRPDCLRIFNTKEMPLEFRYALIHVTFHAGKQLYEKVDPICEEWIDIAEAVLETSSPMEKFNETVLNLQTATATAYLHLRLLFLHITGNLNAATSIALRCSGDSPPHLLYDSLTNTSSFLSRCDPLVDKAVKPTSLWKSQPEKSFFGWFLWALSVDQWIVAHQHEMESGAAGTIDVATGKDLIRAPIPDFARMGIAGLESIALVATEFRRQSGSTPETKTLVGAAIGQLKGIDDKAVGRVQKCYEQGKPQLGNSELVMGNVKIKIKPLTSKPHRSLTDEEIRMATCRQSVAARLAVADGRLWGARGPTLNTKSVGVCSTPSDPCQIIVAYAPIRNCRHDGVVEFRVQVSMCVVNMTQFELNEGIRLELALMADEGDDAKAWGLDFDPESPFFSRATSNSESLKPGEHVTWDVDLTEIQSSNSYQIVPSVVFTNVMSESHKVKWISTKQGEASTVGEQSKSGEDDFQVAASSGKLNEKVESVRIEGMIMTLPPLIFFQPDPLIFVDRNGDIDTFRLLWFRAAHSLPLIRLIGSKSEKGDPVTTKMASMSCLTWEGEAVPDGYASKLWAFTSLAGKRVLVMETTSDKTVESSLHIRGDDAQTLFSICGSSTSRNSFVSSLLPGKQCATMEGL